MSSMKKNGFTISELIIALSVIGIASAIIAPTLNKIMPDQNKAKILNFHSNLSTIVESVLNDPLLYDCKILQEKESDSELRGLDCTLEPIREPYNNDTFSGNEKFANLIYDKLDIERKSSKIYESFDAQTKDGTIFFIQYDKDIEGYHVVMDINGAKEPNSIYSNKDTKKVDKPDRFRFIVGKFGDIRPNDPLTEAYLVNPIKMNDKATDKASAKAFCDAKTYITPMGEIAAQGSPWFEGVTLK